MCALWFIWLLTTPTLSLLRCLVAGFVGGLALLFRVDLGPAMILATLPLMFSLPWRQRLTVALGTTIALVPLGVLAIVVGPDQLVNNLFVFPVLRCNSARHLPLFSVEPYLIRLFFAHLLATILNITAGVLAIRGKSPDRRKLALLATALLAAGVTHVAYQRLDDFHLLFVAFLSIGLLPLSLVIIASEWCPIFCSCKRVIVATAVAVAVAVVVGVLAPDISLTVRAAFYDGLRAGPKEIASVEMNDRSFPVGSEETAHAIQRMLNRLDRLSAPGQRLFVGPSDLRRTDYCDTFIYHLMPKLRPATYFLEMNPFSANRPGSRLADDIQTADWLVLNRLWDVPEESNRSGEAGSNAPNAVVREHFRFLGEYGTYNLFCRKG
jgi:hypothetical protein